MMDIRHLGAAPDDIEKEFDAALIRTHALTLASEALREAQVDLARVDRITTTAHGPALWVGCYSPRRPRPGCGDQHWG
jgi:hypothetical protein